MESEFLIRFDYAIKHMLRDKANFGILEGFIEVFLKKKCKIMEILESESNQDNADDKYNRVDIKAVDEQGEIFIVEVQTTRYTYYLERILYGVSKAVTEQIGSGRDYDKIKQVFSISIVYYDLGVGDDYFYECKSDFIGVHTHNPLQLSRREELTVEQIKQIKDETGKDQMYTYKKITSGDVFPRYYLIRINAFRKVVADAMDEWINFLKNNSIKPDTTAPGLAEARKKLVYARMSKEEQLRYDRRLESLVNEKEAMFESEIRGEERGLKKGEKLGIEKGEKQRAVETARMMKADNEPLEKIIRYSGLTKDEILAL
ncbi:MAG: Rpn family recombination-promoting nuclease/putative transposase [Bacteroidales bacterium]|nr:Rpn family recombination-promoting nuclease/putative transposase [Bacteroidales bacterium]